jgi:predicted ester cyclase
MRSRSAISFSTSPFPSDPSPKKNVDIVKEYMRLAYSPTENKGRQTVEHCHSDAYFIAPTTFPTCKSPQDYAESHSKVMAAVSDLHIDCYDVIFAKGGQVCLRYSASGSHCGEAHNGIEASGKKAAWHAAAIFEVEDGKIKGWSKEWDKLHMWKQLGWMRGDEYA